MVLRRLPLRHKGYWIVLGLFGLAMSLADLNPLYELLPQVPGFNLFRAPSLSTTRWRRSVITGRTPRISLSAS